MAINVSQSFHRTSANAVDDTLTLTKAEMLTVNDNLMPSKYFTVCQDDGKIYLYDKTNTSDPTTGKFRKFEGGSGASDLDDLSDVVLTSPTDGQVLSYDNASSKWVNSTVSSGTTDYSDLTNKPQINSVTLSGNKTSDDLKLQEKMQLTGTTGATSSYVGKVYQYIGGTTTDTGVTFTHGNFYECYYDTQHSKYAWRRVDVQPASTTTLAGLTDTTISSATDGQVLTYNSSSNKWVNANSVSDLNELSDVELSTPTDGEVLKYDTTAGKWINAAGSGSSYTAGDGIDITGTVISTDGFQEGDMSDVIPALPTPVTAQDLDDLGDVVITTPTNGQVLEYDSASSKWVNSNGGGGGASSLDDLTDVEITTPGTGQTLIYDGANNEWVNGDITSGITITKGDLYSTSESIVGQWIDQKPLYQKVSLDYINDTKSLSYDNYGNNYVIYTHTFEGATSVKLYDMSAKTNCSSNEGYIKIQVNSTQVSSTSLTTDVKTTVPDTIVNVSAGDVLQIIFGWVNSHTNIKMSYNGKVLSPYIENVDTMWTFGGGVIRYTKTTDTATNIGVASDYSTTEKIVGTWVDGSPIWKKTLVKNDIAIKTGESIPHEISNLATFIDFSLRLTSTESGYENVVLKATDFIVSSTEITLRNTTASWDAKQARTWYITMWYTKTTS